MRLLSCAWTAALLVCFLAAAAAVRAEDEKGKKGGKGSEGADAANQVLEEIKTAEKSPERTGLAAAVERVPDVHNGHTDAAVRKKLQAALGKVLRDSKAGSACTAAASALARLDDPDGAWKQLSKGLPDPKAKEAGPAQLEALKATATLAPDGAIAPLTKLAQKAKSLDAARESITALGGYGKSKKREAILKELLELTSRHFLAAQAAAQNPKGGSGDAPWTALGEALVGALNRLTGQKHPGGAEWLEAYKANKKKLGALFTEPLP